MFVGDSLKLVFVSKKLNSTLYMSDVVFVRNRFAANLKNNIFDLFFSQKVKLFSILFLWTLNQEFALWSKGSQKVPGLKCVRSQNDVIKKEMYLLQQNLFGYCCKIPNPSSKLFSIQPFSSMKHCNELIIIKIKRL